MSRGFNRPGYTAGDRKDWERGLCLLYKNIRPDHPSGSNQYRRPGLFGCKNLTSVDLPKDNQYCQWHLSWCTRLTEISFRKSDGKDRSFYEAKFIPVSGQLADHQIDDNEASIR
jgi:hypothetical protein